MEIAFNFSSRVYWVPVNYTHRITIDNGVTREMLPTLSNALHCDIVHTIVVLFINKGFCSPLTKGRLSVCMRTIQVLAQTGSHDE